MAIEAEALRALSEKATQGMFTAVSGIITSDTERHSRLYDPDDTEADRIAVAYFGEEYRARMGLPQSTRAKANSEFFAALVNAYRDGSLIHRSALAEDTARAAEGQIPEGVKTVVKYLSEDGDEFSSALSAQDRNEDLARVAEANAALERGATLYEACQLYERFKQYPPPEILKRITAATPLIISHWQCRDNPGYKVGAFKVHGVYVGGDAGSWSGSYGNTISISDLARYAEDTLRKHPDLALPLDKEAGRSSASQSASETDARDMRHVALGHAPWLTEDDAP